MAKKSSVDDFIIDFAKEEQGGGGGVRIREGKHPVKIVAAKPVTSENKGTPGLQITFLVTGGKNKGKKLNDTLWASPKAYSRFRTLLEACGKKVPQKVNLVRIAKAIKGAELFIDVEDEEREGYKARSRVTFDGFIHEDNVDEDDDEDTDDDDDDDIEEDDDDEDEDDEDDLDDLDRKQLKTLIKSEDLDVTVKKSMDDDDLREAIKEAREESDDDDDEEEEDEPAPKAKKGKKKKSKKDDEDDDLDDLDLNEL